MSEFSDKELYGRVLNKDALALELLYDRYEKLLYSFAYRMAGNQQLAEEVVQDVFVKLWKPHAPYSEEKGKFSSWIITLTRNTALDLLRKRKVETSLELIEKDALEATPATTEDLVEWKETGELVRNAVSTLKDEQKKMIDLFYFKGWTQQKIAEATAVPLGTVKGRLRLALKHLRTYIEREGGTPNE